MVHVKFNTADVTINDLLNQYGAGGNYFEGLPFQRGVQRGAGVGDVLRRLWRFVVPLASKAGQALAPLAREVGKEGLMAGSRVLSEVAEGSDVREALAKEGKSSVRRLLKRAAGQEGGGRNKKRRLARSNVIVRPHALDGSLCAISASNKSRADALGPY